MARQLFPHGVLVTGTKIEARQDTLKYLALNAAGTLFQALFQQEQLLAAVDVLQFDAETGWYSIHDHVEHYGTALFEGVCELDLKGIVAKHSLAPYTTERTTWFKIKNRMRAGA